MRPACGQPSGAGAKSDETTSAGLTRVQQFAALAQSAERVLGKDEAARSIRAGGTLRSTSPIGRGGRFRICAVAVRIRRGAPIRPCSPTGRGGGFKYRAIAVRICARTPPCLRSPIGRGPALNAAQCRFEAGRGHHLTRLAQRQSISFTRRGSGSRNSQRVPIERYGHHDYTFDIIPA